MEVLLDGIQRVSVVALIVTSVCSRFGRLWGCFVSSWDDWNMEELFNIILGQSSSHSQTEDPDGFDEGLFCQTSLMFLALLQSVMAAGI